MSKTSVDIQMGLNSKAVKTGLDALRKEIGSFRESTTSAMQGGIVRSMHYLNGALGLVRSTLGGIGSLFESVFKPSADMETLLTQMTTALGDAAKAKQTLQDIVDLSARTPFEMSDLGPAGMGLINLGIVGEEMISTLTKLGDVASGANTELDALISIYSKIKGAGKMQAEELNMLTDRRVNVKALSDMFGGMSGLREQMAKGAVTAEHFEKALAAMTGKGGIYFKSMEAQSKTFAGKLSTLSDAWTSLKVAIGTPIMNALKPLLDDITSKIEAFKKKASDTGTEIGKWVSFFGNAIRAGNGFDALWLGIQKGALETGKVIKDALSNAFDSVTNKFPLVKAIFKTQGMVQDVFFNELLGEKSTISNPAFAKRDDSIEGMIARIDAQIKDLKNKTGGVAIKTQSGESTTMGGFVVASAMEALRAEKDKREAKYKTEADRLWDEATMRFDAAKSQAEQIMGRQSVTIADSLQRIGGGGVAFTRIVDPIEETAKNTAKTNKLIDKILGLEWGPKWAP